MFLIIFQLANISNDGDAEDEEFKSGPAGSTIREQQARSFFLCLVVPLIVC